MLRQSDTMTAHEENSQIFDGRRSEMHTDRGMVSRASRMSVGSHHGANLQGRLRALTGQLAEIRQEVESNQEEYEILVQEKRALSRLIHGDIDTLDGRISSKVSTLKTQLHKHYQF